jgi:hypothetical protein
MFTIKINKIYPFHQYNQEKVMYELNTRTIDEVIETKFFEKIQLTK